MLAGLIGLGGHGAVLQAALRQIAGAALLYGYHPDPQRAAQWDADRGTSDLSRLLGDRRVEAVLIASPTPRHREHVLACLEAGKSVFVEKPLVSTYADGEALIDTAQRHPVPVVMVGHNWRRWAHARAIKRLIREGRLGRLVDVSLTLSHGGAYAFRMTNWRGYRAQHREGPMNALGIHLIDLLHDWFGPIVRVQAELRNLAQVTEAPDATAAVCELAEGVVALVTANYIVPSEERFVVTGTDGMVSWQQGQLFLRIGRDVNRVPSSWQVLPCDQIDTTVEELQEFCDAVDGRRQRVETDVRVGMAAVCVLEACARSATEQRRVSMEEFPLYKNCWRQGPEAAYVETPSVTTR